VPPVGFIGLQGIVCLPVRDSLVHRGVTSRAAFRSFSDASDRPSPGPFESGSFPRALRPLRSSCSGAPGLTLRNAILAYRITTGGHSCPGFRPSSRHHRQRLRSHQRACEVFGPRFVPSSGFLCPSTAFSATDFAGLFHPAATSRVRHPSRGFSRFAAGGDSSPSPSPMPLRRAHSPASRLPSARPPTSGLCSANRRVPRNRRLNRLHGRSPLRVLSFPRYQLDHREPRVTGAIRSGRFPSNSSLPLS